MKLFITLLILFSYFHSVFGQQTILWSVTDTASGNKSTIIGTFHQFGNSFVDSIPQIKEHLYNSDLAIFESIESDEITQKIINDRDESLEIKKHLKRKDYFYLIKLSSNWKVNIHKLKPVELYWKLESEFIKTKCNTVNINDKWDHLDNYLQFLAEEKNIKTIGLETNKNQLIIIDKTYKSPNWKDKKKKISYLLSQLKSEKINSNKCYLSSKYRIFDLDYLLNTECKEGVLLKDRNNEWMQILPTLIKENNCFIAVGLFHLYKKCGLIEQLKNQGFIVKPILLK